MAKKDGAAAPTALEDWLNGRPSWLRMAAAILIEHRRMPTEEEMETLAVHCLAEAANTLDAPHPPLTPGTILGTPSAADLRIDSVSTIRGVNAIGEDATLDLSQGQMTVVYGPNGAGKSGYARLMKHVCGARAKGSIHGNVFKQGSAAASALIKVTATRADGTTASSDLGWEEAHGPHPKLKAVPVFDSATAVEFGDTATTATHLPRAMRFVGMLIQISDGIAIRLKARAAKLTSSLPLIPAEHSQSSAATLLHKLTAKLTEDDIDKACAFPSTLDEERLALETALAQANPEVAHAKAVGELERLSQMATSLSALKDSVSDGKVQALTEARTAAEVKRQAATAYATAFLNGLPLKGVGDAVWRTLWQAARAYSTGHAYPAHPFPHVGEGACCVLCQQPLGDDGKARLASFEHYLNDTLQTEAKSAEDALEALKKALPAPLADVAWQAQCAAIGLETEQATQLLKAIHARLKAMTEATAAPAVEWSVWTNAYDQKVKSTTAERNALAVLLDPKGRAEKETRLRELKARQWLAGQRDAVWADVVRLKRVATVETAVRSTSTNQLTSKSNDIGESELAQGYCDRFNAELQALGGNLLPVRMAHRAVGKGAFTFYIELKDAAGGVKNREILSEGEQRIVTLAAFLADATGLTQGLPVIFDDPISSLDQRYEEAVAKRLVDLAEHRQVIVFTHRLSLMVLLQNAAEQRAKLDQPAVKVSVESIARDGSSTGMPAQINTFSLKPQSGFGQMVGSIGQLKKLDAPLKELALKAACSNFRILVERSVEDDLCSGIVNRYRREIKTLNKLKRLNAITPADCALIDGMMSKYSAFEHSQPTDSPSWLPEPDDLLADVQAMLDWTKEFNKRAEAAAKGNP
ncbi:AAA family ATPase [Xanthomonas hortorum pv. vitians]|uniref:AAA family ATPase n=1 Tax=Xanthomonas hortorum TaxID=56454 RepID=UPI0015D5DB85|nr:AAA family ATPase [Xanthomonas hortorum]MCE4344081.1 AAA family ATPase [Xanthomonas hortorum pv. vitians]NMI19793.1 chromosome segregation protein SMC [Xanthomonas hortorum pv. vitians]